MISVPNGASSDQTCLSPFHVCTPISRTGDFPAMSSSCVSDAEQQHGTGRRNGCASYGILMCQCTQPFAMTGISPQDSPLRPGTSITNRSSCLVVPCVKLVRIVVMRHAWCLRCSGWLLMAWRVGSRTPSRHPFSVVPEHLSHHALVLGRWLHAA